MQEGRGGKRRGVTVTGMNTSALLSRPATVWDAHTQIKNLSKKKGDYINQTGLKRVSTLSSLNSLPPLSVSPQPMRRLAISMAVPRAVLRW